MNWEYMEIGPTPCDEKCAQVGEANYRQNAKKEMQVFIDQLYRHFPKAEELGISFRIKWNNHDFGTYGEVVVYWDDSNIEACEYIYLMDTQIPEKWDEQALAKLNS